MDFNDFSQVQILPRYYFYCCDGRVIKNPIELVKVLPLLREEDFRHHVNQHRNDFSNWINDVFGGDELASRIKTIYDKHMMVKMLEKYFEEKLLMSFVHRQVGKEDFQRSENPVLITDVKGNITYTNPILLKVSGYSADELIGKNPRLFKSGKQPPEFYTELWKNITSHKVFHSNFINRAKDSHLYLLETTITPIRDDKGKLLQFLAKSKVLQDPFVEKDPLVKKVEELKEKKKFEIEDNPIDLLGPDVSKALVEEFDRLYEKTSEARKKGHDTKVIELKLMMVGPKIKIFSITNAKRDAERVKAMLEELKKEIGELMRNA